MTHRRLTSIPSPHPAPAAFNLLVKPTGAACNLECRDCFYLSRQQLYPGSRFRMTDTLLESYIHQLLQACSLPEINIAWQGGEPTLMGLDFFRRSVEYAQKHTQPGQRLLFTIQTNGTQLDDKWATFFRQHDFLVGLSLDGPQELHDTYRVDKGGKGSFDRVMKGWGTLFRHAVDINILCTVHAANMNYPLEIYHFFRDELSARYIQFIPIVERVTAETIRLAKPEWSDHPSGARQLSSQKCNLVTDRSVKAESYGRFLIAIFDEWVHRDIGQVFVQAFDAALASWLGQPSLCIFQPTCGTSLALEHNGDLYACDHFVEPSYLLGNISHTHMIDLVSSPSQRNFGQSKFDRLPRYCRECDVLFACYGECPRNRFINTPGGEPGLNYLCAGYKLFFEHIDHPLRIMADLLRHGRYADEAMKILADEELSSSSQASTRS